MRIKNYIIVFSFFILLTVSGSAADFDKNKLVLRTFVANTQLAIKALSGGELNLNEEMSSDSQKAYFLVIQTKNDTGFIVWGQIASKIPGVHKEYVVTLLSAKSGRGEIWTTTIVDLGGLAKGRSGSVVESRWKKMDYK